MATTQTTKVRPDVAALFMPAWPDPPSTCEMCQKWARDRRKARGQTRGTVVSDMNVLIRRHAAGGHR